MTALRISCQSGPWPLHDAASSRQAESDALRCSQPQSLMQAAGLSLARLALALHPHVGRIVVVAGPGNNGGDGLVAAGLLRRSGRSVRVFLLADQERLPADAAVALQQVLDAGVPVTADWPPTPDPGLVVDAMLGLGTRRAPEGAMADRIDWMNHAAAPVLAIDLPSGLHPDTGVALGASSVRASTTLSLLTLKPGLFTAAGRDHAGDVWFDDLGASASAATAILAGPQQGRRRHHDSHKGSFGDVALVGGGPGMVGAAWLAASAALSAGAGRVYLSTLDDGAGLPVPQRPEIMTSCRWWLSPAPTLASTTVVCGCGGGQAVREALPALLSHARRLVLDADALNAVAADAQLQRLLAARADRGLGTVMTPHPLEAARLLQLGSAAVQADRLAAASRLAQRWRCVTVLKGSGTVVAAPDILPTIIGSGNALLATAGTGDVLAGWVGGEWSQTGDAYTAAVESAWLHGHAADMAAHAGRRTPLLAADLVNAMATLRR